MNNNGNKSWKDKLVERWQQVYLLYFDAQKNPSLKKWIRIIWWLIKLFGSAIARHIAWTILKYVIDFFSGHS